MERTDFIALARFTNFYADFVIKNHILIGVFKSEDGLTFDLETAINQTNKATIANKLLLRLKSLLDYLYESLDRERPLSKFVINNCYINGYCLPSTNFTNNFGDQIYLKKIVGEIIDIIGPIKYSEIINECTSYHQDLFDFCVKLRVSETNKKIIIAL